MECLEPLNHFKAPKKKRQMTQQDVYLKLITAVPDNPEELIAVTCNSKVLSARLF
jgi:hypothetical protein